MVFQGEPEQPDVAPRRDEAPVPSKPPLSDRPEPRFRDATGQSAYRRNDVAALVRVAERRTAAELRGGSDLVQCQFDTGCDVDEVDRWVEEQARAAALRDGEARQPLPPSEELRCIDPVGLVVALAVAIVAPLVFVYNWTEGTPSGRSPLLVGSGAAFAVAGASLWRSLVRRGRLVAVFTPEGLRVPRLGPEAIPWSRVDYARHAVTGYGRSARYVSRLHLTDGSVRDVTALHGLNAARPREFSVIVGRWRDHYAGTP